MGGSLSSPSRRGAIVSVGGDASLLQAKFFHLVSGGLGQVLGKAQVARHHEAGHARGAPGGQRWRVGPLSGAQLKYAAEDVLYLPRLHAALSAHLAADPRKAAWAAAECAAIVPRARNREPGVDLGSIGGAWRLDRPRLAALRALHAWRERVARERDLPRNWVVPDAALLRMAEMPALDERALSGVPDLPEAVRRRHGKNLVSEIAAALALDAGAMPEPVPPPPGPAETRRVKALRARVLEHAEALGVAPEMLAKRRDLEDLVRRASTGEAPASPLLNGWRREAIGESLWELARASV